MQTLASSKVLAPKFVRPVVLHDGLIGYPDMGATPYDRGGEQRAVRFLVKRGWKTHQIMIALGHSYRVLHVVAPHDLDVGAYETHLQAIADGTLYLDEHSGFAQHFAGLIHDSGAQSGPHGHADAWLDFTQEGAQQNAAFWTFSVSTAKALTYALARLA